MSGTFEITEGPIDPARVIAHVARPGAGAVDLFVGVVRDHNDGRAIAKLEYEAYPTMAVQEMQRIGADLTREFPDASFAAIHRVGSLLVGEAAVVCAASAPHRDEAFRACRRLIDEIKARVPVWKREWGEDGPHWINWVDARCDAHGHGPHGGDAR